MELLDLPTELMLQYAFELDLPSIYHLCSVSKEFNQKICRAEHFWRMKLEKDRPGLINFKPKDMTFNKLYHQAHQSRTVDDAAKNGHLSILQWASQLDPPFLPNQHSAILAAGNGHLDVLQWMSQLNPPVLPTQWGANKAAENGHLPVLQWLSQLNPPVLPTYWGANWAAENGHLHVLQWMSQLNPPLLPDQDGLNAATRNGHLDVVKWIKRHNLI